MMNKIILTAFSLIIVETANGQWAHDANNKWSTTFNSGIVFNTASTDAYNHISFEHSSDPKWLIDFATGSTYNLRYSKFLNGNRTDFMQFDYSNDELEILNANVGIGTATPTAMLDINNPSIEESFKLTTGVDGRSLSLRGETINFKRAGASYIAASSTSGSLNFSTGGSDIYNSQIRLRISPNGNVGIGSLSPGFLLHLKDPLGGAALGLERNGKLWRFDVNSTEAKALYIGHSDQSNVMTLTNLGRVGIGNNNPSSILHLENAAPVITAKATNQGSGLRFNVIDQNSDLFRFQKDGITQWTMKSNGSVGIGTSTTGSHKLAVEGSIGAREVKVEASDWSDFVFQEGYKLKSLNEVEEFISTNKHLPDVPNESEVLENGINLGDMNAILLQKVEELTLYLIEQNKKIERLEKEIVSTKKDRNLRAMSKE